MLMLYKYEGKTKEEIEETIQKELNRELNDLFISIEEEEGKLFKSKKFCYSVVIKQDIIDYAKEYINTLGENMNVDIKSEVKLDDDILSIMLVSDNNSILIGKEGRTLSAIQLLLRNSINSKINKNLKVNIDASNYKAKKQKNLEYEIKKIAREVLKTKVEVKLDPMNSYERRCVHNVVATFEDLKSVSYGESPERYVVISYKEN